MKIHMVKKGDTLFEIAKKHGVTVEELLKLNPGITNPDAIDVGMKVKVPSSMPKPPVGDWMHQHKVVQGDTLWKLAKAWGIGLADMIKSNPQLKNPNALLTGEIVNIPKASHGAGASPMPLPDGPELQHMMSEQPVPGKAFTGPIAGQATDSPMPLPAPIEGKTPTAPMPQPMPLPAPIEGKTSTAPIAQPMPLPAPVPVPLPQPMPPVMEKPKHAYPAPAIHHDAVDLFKHYPIPATEAFVPFEMPKHPGAVMGQAQMPFPGLTQQLGVLQTVHPCPPGTMPVGEWGGFGMPAGFPHGGLQAGMHADFHADVHADLHAHAGAGAFGMMPWESATMPMQGMPYGAQGAMHAEPHHMPMPYGLGGAPMMPTAMQAGMPYGMPMSYGMPDHGYAAPMQDAAHPTGKPCKCGCQDRQDAALAANVQDAAGVADPEEKRTDNKAATSGKSGSKDTKKAVIRSTASGSGNGNRKQKARKPRSGKSYPWINR